MASSFTRFKTAGRSSLTPSRIFICIIRLFSGFAGKCKTYSIKIRSLVKTKPEECIFFYFCYMRSLFFFYLLLASLFSFAQEETFVDSLEKALKTTSSDTAKVNILYDLGFEYAYSDFDKAFGYAELALDLSNKNDF